MRSTLLLFAFALNTFAAGPILFGVRGGVPFNLNNTVTSGLSSLTSTKRMEVGPTLGVRLPLGFSIEGDALFRRETLNLGSFAGFNPNVHSDSWEFPVMLKYTGGRKVISPVFGVGAAARHINDFNNLGSIPAFLLNGGSTASNSVGFVTGGGVKFQMGPVQVTPEIRYTRWGGNGLSQQLLNLTPFGANDLSFLVGITF
jgi:hypothetical protein